MPAPLTGLKAGFIVISPSMGDHIRSSLGHADAIDSRRSVREDGRMDDKPTINRPIHSLTVEVVMAVVLCLAIAVWWSGRGFTELFPSLIVVLHVCAAYQVAKVAWMIYWWRRLARSKSQ
jgi:hypothetical protein